MLPVILLNVKVNGQNLWEVNEARRKLGEFVDYIKISLPADVVEQGVSSVSNKPEILLSMKSMDNEHSEIVDRPTLVVWIFDEEAKDRTTRNIVSHVTSEGAQVEVKDGTGESARKLWIYYDVVSQEEKRDMLDSTDF